MAKAEYRAIDELARRETELFLAEQAKHFVACAINLAVSSMSVSATIRLLRDHIEILEEFG